MLFWSRSGHEKPTLDSGDQILGIRFWGSDSGNRRIFSLHQLVNQPVEFGQFLFGEFGFEMPCGGGRMSFNLLQDGLAFIGQLNTGGSAVSAMGFFDDQLIFFHIPQQAGNYGFLHPQISGDGGRKNDLFQAHSAQHAPGQSGNADGRDGFLEMFFIDTGQPRQAVSVTFMKTI